MSKSGGAQFTPGTWYVHSNKIAVGDKDSDRHIIADIRGMDAFSNPTPDAALIAAAPAMYEALQAALAYFMRSKQSHAPEARIIRTVLAQAEGRQG